MWPTGWGGLQGGVGYRVGGPNGLPKPFLIIFCLFFHHFSSISTSFIHYLIAFLFVFDHFFHAGATYWVGRPTGWGGLQGGVAYRVGGPPWWVSLHGVEISRPNTFL